MDIVELLDRAAARLGVNSGRSLARALNISSGLLSRYQLKQSVPNDETMLRICALANVDPARGLLLVNMWRSKSHARAIYARLLKGLPAIADEDTKNSRKHRTREEQSNTVNT
ncbi:MAG TPA: hypothetical protein VGG48_19160 [Rhizomicrobium sp.]|jgi:transcriptional regulator with XRE-family HTH domain